MNKGHATRATETFEIQFLRSIYGTVYFVHQTSYYTVRPVRCHRHAKLYLFKLSNCIIHSFVRTFIVALALAGKKSAIDRAHNAVDFIREMKIQLYDNIIMRSLNISIMLIDMFR